MRITDIIAKKRDGGTLTSAEIEWFIREYVAGNVQDYQAAAWLMAVFIRGMSREEIVALTQAMAHSGDMVDLSDVVKFAVDKHSSGGVGDKTSLAVLPMVAACGVPVAKMSGRGLGHTGGTLDKLESISGFRVELSETEFKEIARKNGLVLAGQSHNLAPADKMLYALRDVTATVDNIPLIASSIMSKKLASGADAIVLDVKVGLGAFMKSVEDARELAKTMVNIGVDAGRKMVALISDMNQPLGVAAGLAVEVKEAIEMLQGRGAADFEEHCIVVAAHMLRLAGQGTLDECIEKAKTSIVNGTALARFRQMVQAQGGDVSQIDHPEKLPQAHLRESVTAGQDGYIQGVDALAVGYGVVDLGGGRLTKTDPVDHAVGILTHVKVGQPVKAGDVLFTLLANEEKRLDAARQTLRNAVTFSADPVEPLPLFYDTIEGL